MTGTITRGTFSRQLLALRGNPPNAPLRKGGETRFTIGDFYKPKTWVSQARLYLQA